MDDRRHVFLDRDGTINIMPVYPIDGFDSPRSPDDLQFYPGALAALVRLAQDCWVHVVTNQPGVAYGKLPNELTAHRVNHELRRQVLSAGGRIDSIETCFHTQNHGRIANDELRQRYFHPNHPNRKPAPGMLLDIGQRFDVDFTQAVMIGDRAIDLEAGARAGCGTLILVRNPDYPEEQYEGAVVCLSLTDAIQQVLG